MVVAENTQSAFSGETSRRESPSECLRILAVAENWQGSDAYAYVKAFRNFGHSVKDISQEHVFPAGWQHTHLRIMRRLLTPMLVRQFSDLLMFHAETLQPHLFFVFKGTSVQAKTIRQIRQLGAVAINVYPDVSFTVHGSYLPAALPEYDWVFTTKTFGLADMKQHLGIDDASFLPPSFDPEVHRPVALDHHDSARYGCDVSFIGTWSPKKQRLLEAIVARSPNLRLKVWGNQWERARPILGPRIQGREVTGLEYSKAMLASKINLCILSEIRPQASSGDRITARTFQIPATGAFMLHERTAEFAEYFDEGTECGCFETAEELVRQIEFYLGHDDERTQVAAAGRARSIASDYSVHARAEIVIRQAQDMLAAPRQGADERLHRTPLTARAARGSEAA